MSFQTMRLRRVNANRFPMRAPLTITKKKKAASEAIRCHELYSSFLVSSIDVDADADADSSFFASWFSWVSP